MAPRAPATERFRRDVALVLCAHGARGGVGAAAAHAKRLRALRRFGEVHACALKGWPGVVDTIAAVRAATLVVAPLLMAEGYTLAALHRRLERAVRPELRLLVCPPVGVNPHLIDLIAAKALDLCADRGWTPAATALLIAGHGTERHPDSGATAHRHAARLAARRLFAEVAVGFLDEEPRVPEAVAALSAASCVAVGLFADAGEHGQDDLPALLAPDWRAAYAGPIGPDPRISELILGQVGRALDGSVAA